jgi:hypothetical protein
MTFFCGITGYRSLWAVVDRRLSSGTRVVADDAVKLMALDTRDARALLVYAGLGATRARTQPSQWMSNVLRGRDVTLEASLGLLCDAILREFPPHLAGFPRKQQGHVVFASAFAGTEPRAYQIQLAPVLAQPGFAWRYVRRTMGDGALPPSRPFRATLGGSGARLFENLRGEKLDKWVKERRDIFRLIKACEHERIPPEIVATSLASLNLRVSRSDPGVGPRCIVAWRFRDQARPPRVVGFSEMVADKVTPRIAHITGGLDLAALTSAVLPFLSKSLRAMRSGSPDDAQGSSELEAVLRALPDDPDEKLR